MLEVKEGVVVDMGRVYRTKVEGINPKIPLENAISLYSQGRFSFCTPRYFAFGRKVMVKELSTHS